MFEIFSSILVESWRVLVDAAPYVLFGFFVAGLLKAFVSDTFLANHLGRNSVGSVFKAALIGVPLPLCSCGVLPAALGLRKQGASKGATTAFMISTPETGIDSMVVTYALIDPIMTAIRPIAAMITAVFAGILVNAFPEQEKSAPPLDGIMQHVPPAHSDCGCQGGCDVSGRVTLISRFLSGMEYAFGEMISDIGRWLLVGVLIAGVISAVLPQDAFSEYVGNDFWAYLIMLVVALPLYVCATASTPIAASLLLKGLSPGAALVFLLAGPATNGATITVMLKTLGKRAAALYVISIVICSLTLAFGVDAIYRSLGLNIQAVVMDVGEILPEWIGVLCSVILIILVVRSFMRPSDCGG